MIPPRVVSVTKRLWLPHLVALAMFLLPLSLAGCSLFGSTPPAHPAATVQPTQHTQPTAYHDLEQRPLHLPTLAAGAPCLTTKGRQVNPGFGIALGNGPVYPVGLGTEGVLEFGSPQNFGSHDWGGQKVLWIVSSTYHGLVLIRGRQIDGTAEVRFEFGDIPPTVLEFDASITDPNEWTGLPSYTRLRAPGCYAYQVDGDGFSEVIVFQAVPRR